MKLLLSAITFILSQSLMAGTLPLDKREFCARYADATILESFSNDSANLMAFKNNGGLFNGGVCWWHSRFQRNIFYLAIFRPDLNKPKASEISQLIKEKCS